MSERVLAEQISQEPLLVYYKKMLELRLFELKVQELYRNGRLPGFVHSVCRRRSSRGWRLFQSPIAGLDLQYPSRSWSCSCERCPARIVLAELWGKVTGSSGGRGGSMHMYAPEYGFMGTNGIVGAPIPLATGAALSAKLKKNSQVVVCFFGDGAVNSGSFHEAVNLGAVWNLPVVYVCENNLYATEMAFLARD